MKPITLEWIQKAEADFATAQRELKASDRPNYDGVCFHCQQCAEKYLKAILCEWDMRFGKIHDLVSLLEQIVELFPNLEDCREDLAYLSDFAVTFRYPGESADQMTAEEAMGRCGKFRDAIHKVMRLDT